MKSLLTIRLSDKGEMLRGKTLKGVDLIYPEYEASFCTNSPVGLGN